MIERHGHTQIALMHLIVELADTLLSSQSHERFYRDKCAALEERCVALEERIDATNRERPKQK